MNRLVQNIKAWIAILVTVAVTACGSGDEYDGFDDTVDQSTPNKFLTFFNSQNGEYNQSNFAEAYYAAIDPENARSTAQDYIALHGLDNPDVHVIFRDAKDLGYGRDMYMRSYPNPSSCGGQVIAFLVRNFSVQIVEGFAYGPVNLEAAVDQDLQHHVGTNAIEFGLGRADMGDPCSSEPIAKFYTYQPIYDPSNATHPRRIRVDLDGRGEKAMPQPCITCHGGKLRPLDRFGRFVAMHASDQVVNSFPFTPGDTSDIGSTKSRLQAFEVDAFEFSDEPGYRRVDVEEDLRLLNAAVYCTYPGSQLHPACAVHGGGVMQADFSEWSGDFARDMLLGWYGDDGFNDALSTAGSKFSDSFVPTGWDPSLLGRPQGTDTLFTKVVGPNCFVCHGKRGVAPENDVDFSTWEKFISYADDIEQLVFDEGRMPLGLLNNQNFWGDPEKAELLASFIESEVTDSAGFQARRRDSKGKLIQPGRIVARAGPDRVTMANDPITLNAQASLFAESYSWSVLMSPPGSTTSISDPSAMKIDFSADMMGSYTVRLDANSSEGGSRSDTLDVEVVAILSEAPRDITFYPHIRNYMATAPCTDCHSNVVNDVPMLWLDDSLQQPIPVNNPYTAANPPSLGFYEQFRVRVNLEIIEDSLVLKKPSGFHHNGNQLSGFDLSFDVGHANRADYDRFLNWIAEGAPCGGTANQCP